MLPTASSDPRQGAARLVTPNLCANCLYLSATTLQKSPCLIPPSSHDVKAISSTKLRKSRKMSSVTPLVSICVLILLISDVSSLAAKKRGSRKAVASSQRGFGVSPAKAFDDFCASLTTRIPHDLSTPCACGSEKSYADCCRPFHLSEKYPETPQEILQTRYSAFCYRIVPYVIETTDKACRDYRENKLTWAKDLHKSGMFDSYDFVRLEKLDSTPGKDDNEAFVKFKVYLQDKMTSDQTAVSEKSQFLRGDDGKWRYASGEVRSETAGLEGAKLN